MHDAKNAQSALAQQIAQTIADEIGAQSAQVRAAVGLLDEGASVPFIARYRKEVTGGLDDTQLRNLETRLTYLRELEDRRAAVLASIGEQGKLSDELRNDILAADTKSRLEDLYLPYKPKRRTRAQIAREAGLEPLADGLLADPTQDPQAFAATFVDTDKGVADTKAALEGARAILMERWGEDAALVGELRTWLGETGVIRARVAEGKETREFDGKHYVMETALRADVALVKAWKADEAGNLVFRKTARNFNPACAMAGKVCIVEVEEVVPVGAIDPDQVHLPGIYVHRIVHNAHPEKRIEQRTIRAEGN